MKGEDEDAGEIEDANDDTWAMVEKLTEVPGVPE